MEVSEYSLFPTKLLSIQFEATQPLNKAILNVFATEPAFQGDFNMHPSACNLLHLEEKYTCFARLREMFLEGLSRWLASERLSGHWDVSVVLFPALAKRGDFTVVHNHGAEVVGIYYVQTSYDETAPKITTAKSEYDYFDQDDGVLLLHDPRFNANLLMPRSDDYVKVFPRPGQMLIFPGYLWHSVLPHQGTEQRMAISANFGLSARSDQPTPGVTSELVIRE